MKFDKILERNIKTGPFQVRTLSVVGLLEVCDGVEYAFLSILIAILTKEWDLTQRQVATLGSSFLFGVMIGNLVCAYVADLIGRRISLILFTGVSVILVIITSYSQNYEQIILLRLLFGIVQGSTGPVCCVMISEIVEAKYRGRFTYSLAILYIAGNAYLVLLCFYFLDDYESGNWRGLIRFNALPAFLCFIGSIFILQESVRYLLNQGKYVVAFLQIDYMSQVNELCLKLTNNEKDQLLQWQLNQNKLNQQNDNNQQSLLSKQYIGITLKIWGLLIIMNYQNMSVFLLMPFLLQSNHSGFGAMLLLNLAELIFSAMIYQLIDNPSHGGRIKIVILASFILIFTNLALYGYGSSILFYGMLVIKLSTRGVFSVISILTCESYPLILRARGSGLAQAIGKLAAVPAPYILFPLYQLDPYLPFGLMTILAIIMFLIAWSFPTDKTQKELDESI